MVWGVWQGRRRLRPCLGFCGVFSFDVDVLSLKDVSAGLSRCNGVLRSLSRPGGKRLA